MRQRAMYEYLVWAQLHSFTIASIFLVSLTSGNEAVTAVDACTWGTRT